MGIGPDWDKLKEELISAGMQPFKVTETYSDDFKNINWDLKDAREKRQELLAKYLRTNWMDCLKNNEDNGSWQMTGFVELAFSDEKFTLYEVNNE